MTGLSRIAGLSLVLGVACSGGSSQEVPIESIPLGDSLVECAAKLAFELDESQLAACVYFEGSPCVLVADVSALGAEGCGAGCLSKQAWMKFCAGDGPGYDLETNAGDEVPTVITLAPRDMPNGQPAGCGLEVPAVCNGSTSDRQSSPDCLARLSTTLRVADDGSFEDIGAEVELLLSGFVQEELGRFESGERSCPGLASESCPVAAPSCRAVSLELVSNGAASGIVSTGGEACTSARCTYMFPAGRTVDVSAEAAPGAVIARWSSALGASGDCNRAFVETASTSSCTVTLADSGQITATFGYGLDLVVDGEGHVTGSPGGVDGDGIDCMSNQSCPEIYDSESTVTLMAEQTMANWQFSSWAGGPCAGSASPSCTVRMTENVRIAARFGYEIDLTVSGDGTVRMAPPGINCGPDANCVETYGSMQQVVLTPIPNSGSVFAGWGNGPCTGTAACTLTLTEAVTLSAGFAYEVDTAAVGGTANITRSAMGVPCSTPRATCQAHLPGTALTFTTNPPGGATLIEWQGCTGSGNSCMLEVQAATTVSAVFGFVLDVSFSGQGSLGFMPEGVGSCGAASSVACVAGYPGGTVVRITATPGSGYALRQVSNCVAVANMPGVCDVTLSAARSVSAAFGRQVTVTKQGLGTVNSTPGGIACGTDCTEVFDDGTLVTLIGTPAAGSLVSGFTGCTAMGTGDRCQFNVTAPTNITVDFGREISVVVVGAGTVTSSPPGISCTSSGGAGCTAAFAVPSAVNLAFASAPAWETLDFTNCTGDANGCTIGGASGPVTVRFGRELTIQKTGDGTVVTRAPSTGINCGTDCTEVFLDGRSLGVRATPGVGSQLVGYTGCSNVVNNDCDVVMNGPVTVAVEFGYVLSLAVTGGGRVVSTPGDINCLDTGGTCSEAFGAGTMVVLDASPKANYEFAGWGGCTPDASIATRCRVTMSQAANVSAFFERELQVAVTGDGSVTSSPVGITCGSTCTGYFANNTVVTLTAVAGAGGTFSGWQGCTPVAGTPTQCTIAMSTARGVAVTFDAGVTVNIADGLGTVTSNPAGINCPGTCNAALPTGNITLTAVPSAGYVIRDWNGCTQQANPNQCVFSANVSARTIHVRFGRQVDVSLTPSGAAGTVLSGGIGINCGADCSAVASNGSNLRFIAHENANFRFYQWTGCSPDPAVPTECTLVANGAQNIDAEFGRALETSVIGQGAVSASPGGVSCGPNCTVYPNGADVALTANPAAGWSFIRWIGCTPNTNNPCTVAMSNPRNITAEFGRQLTINKTGLGTVISAPGGINCGTTCNFTFDPGVEILLTGNPTGNRTVLWTGCTVDAVNPNRCRVTMDGARTVGASFVDIRDLDIDMRGGGSGIANFSPPALDGTTSCTADCTAQYANGVSVFITATPVGGATFRDFGDDCSGASCVVVMSSDRQVRLHFDP